MHTCQAVRQFIQVPSYQQESSMVDQEMTIELMQQIQGVNIRIYRQEISGLQISNDSELQNMTHSLFTYLQLTKDEEFNADPPYP